MTESILTHLAGMIRMIVDGFMLTRLRMLTFDCIHASCLMATTMDFRAAKISNKKSVLWVTSMTFPQTLKLRDLGINESHSRDAASFSHTQNLQAPTQHLSETIEVVQIFTWRNISPNSPEDTLPLLSTLPLHLTLRKHKD